MFSNAELPIHLKDSGNWIEYMEAQFLNALFPIWVNAELKTIEPFKVSWLAKTLSPIDVNL